MPATLFSPITLRGVEIRNRLWVAPMCQYSVEAGDGIPTAWHLVHLGSLARGGAGAVIVEATGVLPEGRISGWDTGLWNDAQRDAFGPIVDFVHSQGAVAGIQLSHAGRKASTWPAVGERRSGTVPLNQGGWTTVAPSAVPLPGLAVPQELNAEGIAAVVAAFRAAARRAVEAGFDLIEVHGAHGYLLHQFLSPLSNRRRDEYGGSWRNRARLLLDVVDAIRAEVGDDVPLLVRLSATDWVDGGLTLEDIQGTVGLLREHDVDLVDVSSGGNAPASIPLGPGYQVPFAATIRESTGMPVGTVGLITEPAQAEQIIVTGQADVVLVAREVLRDPHFPLRAAAALGAQIPYPAPYARAYA